ncbi:MAG: hypothetical protein KGM17_12395 [Sphingomonadales bacterium]|nr:hypothetical protein [Sphingomonadales bacterium]
MLFFYLPFCSLNFHQPQRRSVERVRNNHYGNCVRCGKRIVRAGPKYWKARALA